MERALYSAEGRRNRTETLIQYISRKKTLMNDMDRHGCQLPSNFRGYIILRDALLTDRAWDTVEQWTEGSYDQEKVITALK